MTDTDRLNEALKKIVILVGNSAKLQDQLTTITAERDRYKKERDGYKKGCEIAIKEFKETKKMVKELPQKIAADIVFKTLEGK